MAKKPAKTESTALVAIQEATLALAECTSISEVKEIRDKAEAARVYFKQRGGGHLAEFAGAEFKIRAERRLGELLSEMDRSRGGRPKPLHRETVLGDIGITRLQCHRWETEAILPDKEFEQHVAKARDSGRELTSRGVYQLGRQYMPEKPKRRKTRQGNDTPCVADLAELEGKTFGTIYADPPWQYGNQGTRAATGNHYATMTVDQLCEMPIEELAAEDAHLHLWTTNAFLPHSFKVIEAWGFEYKSCFVWVKPQMGIGNYWRVSHEFLLLGVRGDAKRFDEHDKKSWLELPRGKHSAKPEEIRTLIEKVSPGGFLELFGRRPAAGWTVFGNEVSGLFA